MEIELDYSKKTVAELITICKEKKIKGYSDKKKNEIIKLILEPIQEPIQKPIQKPIQVNKIVKIVKKQNKSIITDNVVDKIIVQPQINITAVNQETNNIDTGKLKMIDLCAGTGAFSMAFTQTGNVDVIFANDMVESSKIIYDDNFNHKLFLKDLNKVNVLDIPKHDILTAGFSCQPFSIAGKQKGFQDNRSDIFWKLFEIIEHHKPQCFIFENVKNLLSHDDKKTFKIILDNIAKYGYNVKYKVLNTSEITGIPQNRERVYIIGIKSKEVYDKFNLDFPNKDKKKITQMLETNTIPDKYYYTNKSSTWTLLSTNVTEKDKVYQYRRVYVRENKSDECPTLTANMGTGGHNVPIILDDTGIRKLTPRECFNFQGFPSSYKLPKTLSDASLYKLAGNAVSVPVVSLIADKLVPLLLQNKNIS